MAGDFNGAARRCDNRNNISTIEEAFADCALPMPPGPTPLWGPGSIPGKWADGSGFLKPPESDRHWKGRLHGAFFFPHEALGIRPTDQSCHHETWLHLDFVGWRDEHPHREKHDRRILLKERSALYHYGKQRHAHTHWHGENIFSDRDQMKYQLGNHDTVEELGSLVQQAQQKAGTKSKRGSGNCAESRSQLFANAVEKFFRDRPSTMLHTDGTLSNHGQQPRAGICAQV